MSDHKWREIIFTDGDRAFTTTDNKSITRIDITEGSYPNRFVFTDTKPPQKLATAVTYTGFFRVEDIDVITLDVTRVAFTNNYMIQPVRGLDVDHIATEWLNERGVGPFVNGLNQESGF